jgi:holliday junction DNA helicase RuvA
MISYIKGEITFKSPVFIIVENMGIGYHANISLNTFSKIEHVTKDAKIFIHSQIKEDSARSFVQVLYGFAEEVERDMFINLTSVSGVGYNTARLVLSSMTVDEIRHAIANENVVAINKVKGIGPKTAKQIILDLKEKMSKQLVEAGSSLGGGLLSDNPAREDAISALVALGFARLNVQKVLNKIIKEQPTVTTVDEMIKVALRLLS